MHWLLRLVLAAGVFSGAAWGGARWARRPTSAPTPAAVSAPAVALPASRPTSLDCDTLLRRTGDFDAASLSAWLRAHPSETGACADVALLRLAELDAASALSFVAWSARPEPAAKARLGVVFSVLAHTDRLAAETWLANHGIQDGGNASDLWVEHLTRANLAVSLERFVAHGGRGPARPLRQLAMQVGGEARSWLARLPQDDETQRSARNALAAGWAERDPVQALAWAETLDDSDLGEVLGVCARVRPAEVAARVAERASDGRLLFPLKFFVAEWQKHDFPAARAFVLSLRKELQHQAADALMKTWVERSPVEALAFAARFPRPDYLIHNALEQWTHDGPAAVGNWLMAQPAGALRSEALKGYFTACQWEPAQATFDFLRRLPEPNQLDRRLLQKAFGSWSWQEPAAARSWAESLTTPAERENFLAEWAGAQDSGDPIATTVLLDLWRQRTTNVEHSDRLSEVARRVGREWIEEDPAAAARWLAQMPGARVTQTFRSAVSEWHRLEPEVALAWALTLTERFREQAVASIFDRLARQDPAAAALQGAGLPTDVRSVALSSVREVWQERDPAGTQAWIARDRPQFTQPKDLSEKGDDEIPRRMHDDDY